MQNGKCYFGCLLPGIVDPNCQKYKEYDFLLHLVTNLVDYSYLNGCGLERDLLKRFVSLFVANYQIKQKGKPFFPTEASEAEVLSVTFLTVLTLLSGLGVTHCRIIIMRSASMCPGRRQCWNLIFQHQSSQFCSLFCSILQLVDTRIIRS